MAIEVRWGSATHVGCIRTTNQDAILAGPVVFAVADGMGGHAAGEVASALTVAVMSAIPGGSPGDVALESVREANRAVIAQAAPGSGREGMGTTLSGVALVTRDDRDALLVVNVGDSRTYLLDANSLVQVTTDHSLVAEMVRDGKLCPSEALNHRARNVVTRAIGIDDELTVDHWWIQPEAGQMFLMCSDGLSNEVPVDEMESILRTASSPQVAADSLVGRALDNGARDNVSAIALMIDAVTLDPSAVEDDTNRRSLRASSVMEHDEVIDAVPGGTADPEEADLASSPPPAMVTGVPSSGRHDQRLDR